MMTAPNVPVLARRRRLLSPSTTAAAIQHWIDSPTPLPGQAIHSLLIKTCNPPNTNISIKLLILHLKCNSLTYARQMLDEIPRRTLSAFNYLIAAYSKQNLHLRALELTRELISSGENPDQFTLSMILKTSAAVKTLNLCKEAHSRVVRVCGGEEDEILLTALIDSYVKNESLDSARKVFDRSSLTGNVVCATAMISGYMRKGLMREAEDIFSSSRSKDVVAFNAMIEGYSSNSAIAVKSMELFIKMQRLGLRPTISTFASVIGACAAIWSSMIDGYGKNGMAVEALDLFRKMEEGEVFPNDVTFLAVLSACSHGGLVKEGKEIMEKMERNYSVRPNVEHFACVVDLLGRAGKLEEAFEFIEKMPCRPNSDVWGALLGACRLHGEVELAALAAREIFEASRKERSGAYVALSNTFAAAGEWRGVCEVRKMMKSRGVSKETANSWI